MDPIKNTTITSVDGAQYKIAKTPGILDLTDVLKQPAVDVGDNFRFFNIYVKCEEIRQKGLPLDANPREPTMGDVVKRMEETLRKKPEKFHHWNNGMTLICEDIVFNDTNDSVKLKFPEGTGICNGGHTYFSIVTWPGTLPNNCIVHLEIIELPDGLEEQEKKKTINDIAEKRNRNRQLLPTTQADYLGYYDKFKSFLGDNKRFVRWHEGDSEAHEGAINSELFIRMLAVVDPFWYQHHVYSPGRNNHKGAATSSRGIHSRWFDGTQNEGNDPNVNLYHLGPLANELFKIRDLISYSMLSDSPNDLGSGLRNTIFYYWLANKSGGKSPTKKRPLHFYQSGHEGLDLPNPFLIMILGAFRSNIWLSVNENGYPNYIGFYNDPEELWNETKSEVIKKLRNGFDDSDQDPNHFIKQVTPYDVNFLQEAYGRRLPNYPCKFCEIEKNNWFLKDTDSPTHVLEYQLSENHGFGRIAPVGDKKKHNEEELYRKI